MKNITTEITVTLTSDSIIYDCDGDVLNVVARKIFVNGKTNLITISYGAKELRFYDDKAVYNALAVCKLLSEISSVNIEGN